jgi:UDP:flavonoid glycosyltransferase YjiC (YdhE family)
LSRILLTWELGLNLGHLARLLPVARELKARGHVVLVAARDLTAAARVLAPAGISFVQAPHLTQRHALSHRPAGYSDILRAQGWGDLPTLRGLVEGWINLYRMYRPDVVVSDYSPTAEFASVIARLPRIAIGNGFELPPARPPLPPFPGFSWATQAQAAQSEALVLQNAAGVARCFEGGLLDSLSDLFDPASSLYVTFPELDHYRPRSDVNYVGPLATCLSRTVVRWPDEYGEYKVFVCIRRDTCHADPILSSLRMLKASVICVALGFTVQALEPHRASNIVFSTIPVDLSQLARDAELCVSYGAEGTMATFLLEGVPQLISPDHVETYMALHRLEQQDLGAGLRGPQTADTVSEIIQAMLQTNRFGTAAREFKHHYCGYAPSHAVHMIVNSIEETARGARPPRDIERIKSAVGGHS